MLNQFIKLSSEVASIITVIVIKKLLNKNK